MTIKRGENKPWHRKARAPGGQPTRSTVRTSSGGSTAARPSTRGMCRPATVPGRCRTRELRREEPEVRPADGEEADGGRRPRQGVLGHDDDVRPGGLSAGLRGGPVAAQGDQHRRRDRDPGGGHLRRQQRPGRVRLGCHRSRHARRRRRIHGRVPPCRPPMFQIRYPEYRNVKAWRGIGNGRIQLEPEKRVPIYKDAQRESCSIPRRSRSSRSRSTRSCAGG